MKNNIELKKRGYFYYCYNEDAVLIHYLFDYKIVSGTQKVGFPIANLNRVLTTLEEYKINYVVLENTKVIQKKDYRKVNNYARFYRLALSKIQIEDRFTLLENEIKNLPDQKILKILELVENEVRK